MNLKLLFDCHTFDREPQGTSTFLAGLINQLPATLATHFPGVQIEIHCAGADRQRTQDYLDVPFQFHAMPTGFMARNLVHLPRIARALKADAVVSQYVRPVWVPKHSIAVIHDLLFLDFPDQFSATYRYSRHLLFGLSARHSSKVFTVSTYSRAQIASVYGIQEQAIGILPNAVGAVVPPAPPLPAPARRPDEIRLLYVSRLERRKRHEWCVRALEDLLAQGVDAHLTLIGGGGGAYAAQLAEDLRAKSASTGGRLVHHPQVSAAQLQQAYMDCDVFVFPSLGEGFGIPVIEAAAHGKPCVVTDGSALRELKDFYSGLAFEPGSYESFLTSLRAVIEGLPSFRTKAAAQAGQVTDSFSWDIAARRLVEGLLDLEA